jgi:branched-chain amino acid transport system permease protein
MDIFLQQIINGLVLGSIYALIALGYTMVYGVLGIINFAHGEVLMIGAMVSLSLLRLILGFTSGLPGWRNPLDCFASHDGSLCRFELLD